MGETDKNREGGMRFLEDRLAKALTHLGVPFEDIRMQGQVAIAVLKSGMDFPGLVTRIRRDPRYDKYMESAPDGVFIMLPDVTEPNHPFFASLAIKFEEHLHKVTRVTCVLHRARVFCHGGEERYVFTLDDLHEEIARDDQDEYLEKESNSVA